MERLRRRTAAFRVWAAGLVAQLRRYYEAVPDDHYYSWKSVRRRLRLVAGWLLMSLGILAVLDLFADNSYSAWWSLAALLVFGVPGYFIVFRIGSRQEGHRRNDSTGE